MGLALLFYLGDPAAITNAFESMEMERFEEPEVVSHSADFSLHLIPRDLDFLSARIGETLGQEQLDLRPFLNVMHDEVDGGMFCRSGLGHVCGVGSARSRRGDRKFWVVAADFAHGGLATEANSDCRKAVLDLIILCKAAASNDGQVFHIWYA